MNQKWKSLTNEQMYEAIRKGRNTMRTMISITVALILIVLAFGSHLTAQEDGRIKLTVEETLGAVFMHEVVSDVSPTGGPTVLASANPKAKPKLYQLLSHKHIAEYHRNILIMIGYMGNDEDVIELEQWLDKSFKGELSRWEYGSITALFDALAIMSRRGIEPAQTLLGRLATPDYWDSRIDFTIPASNAFVAGHPIDALLLYSLPHYATSGADDWKEKITNYLGQIQDEGVKEYMSGQLNTELIQAQIKEVSETRYPPIPDDVRDALPHMFNGDMENPGRARPPGRSEPAEARAGQDNGHHHPGMAGGEALAGEASDTEATLARNVAREAMTEFEKIKALVVAGEFASVAARLLDDGEPLKEENPQDSPQFKEAITMEQRIFGSLDQVQTTPSNLQIERHVQYAFDSLGEGGEPEDVRMRETVALTFELKGSHEVEQELFQTHRGTRTVADDGTLIVVMRKIDGKWYWNPFGW